MANGGDRAATEWRTSFYGGSTYGLRRRTFLKVYANAGEKILLGSSAVGVGSGDIVVWNPGLITTYAQSQAQPLVAYSFSCKTSQSGNGQLTTRAQELAGPLPNSGGYNPCTYTAPTTGVYWVAFYGPSGGSSDTGASSYGTVATPIITAAQNSTVSLFDITVRNSTNTTTYNGRAYTDYLVQQTGSNGQSSRVYSTVYAVTKDGFKYQIDMRGLDPNAYILYGNTVGFLNPDGITPLYHDLYDGLNDNLSAPRGGVRLSPPTGVLFFNLPHAGLPESIVPVPLLPSVSSIVFAGTAGGNNSNLGTGGNFVYTGNVGGVAEVVIAPNPGECANANYDPNVTTNRVLRAALPGGVQNLAWDGKNNGGTNMPVSAPGYCFKATLHAGEYHFPLLDAENSMLGGPTITLLNPPGGTCPLATCRTAFFDDRGYRTTNGTVVGTLGAVLPGNNPPPSPYYSTTGFDTASTTIRRYGNDGSTGFGDKKGLDLWTYYPSPDVVGQLYIVTAGSQDLAISKVHSGDFVIGADNTYTITVRNVGTGSITGAITVTDSVPDGLPVTSVTAASPWTCDRAGQSVTCTTASMTVAAGASLPDITLTVSPIAPVSLETTSVTNTANVSITVPEDNYANNTSSSPTTIASADLAVTKTASAPSPVEGSGVTFTITVTNNGPSIAEGVSVADAIPSGLTYGSYTASQGSYDSGTGIWTVGTLLSSGTGSTATLTLNTTVNVGQSGQTINNTATVSGGPYDYNMANNTATATLTVPTTALTGIITDQATGLPIEGATVRVTDSDGHIFTLTTGADGRYTATGSPATPLSAGTATTSASAPGYVTATTSPTVVAGTTTTQDLTLAPLSLSGAVTVAGTGVPILGATVTLTSGTNTCTTTTGAGGAYSFVYPTCPYVIGGQTVTVTASQTHYANGTATPIILSAGPTTQDLALATADLVVYKTDNKTVVSPGERLEYTITVVNIGTIAAETVTLVDKLAHTWPRYLTYVSATGTNWTCTPQSADIVNCAMTGTLAPGASTTITFIADVATSLPDGTTTISNYAQVSTTSPEADVTNNEVSDEDTVTTHPDLTIAKTFTSISSPAGPPAQSGSTVSYKLSGGNIGYATATGVTIVDTLDGLTAYDGGTATLKINGVATSFTSVSYDNGTKKLTMVLPDLSPTSTYEITYSVTVGTLGANPDPLYNMAVISENETDLDDTNKTAGVYVPTAADKADVYVVKSAEATPDPAAPVVPGGKILYTIAYGNSGPAAADNVTITDAVPANTTFVSATDGGTESGGTVTWNLGTLANGATGTVTFIVQVNNPLPAGVTAIANTATISTTTSESTTANNSSNTNTSLTTAPDLVITKTDGRTEVLAGDSVQYTISYRNVGNIASENVTIVDTLLSGVTYVSSDPAGTYDEGAGTVTWNAGTLAADGSWHTITLNVTVKADALPGSVAADRVTITGSGVDPNPGNNTATDSNLVITPYIVLEKQATSPAYVSNQLTYSYTIAWHNTGAATAKNVVIEDTLPANTALVEGSITGGGTCSATPCIAGSTITWNLGDKAADAAGTVGFSVTVNAGAGGALKTTSTLSTETESGSVTVTSSFTAPPTGTRPWCELDACAAFKGIYQDTNGIPPMGWNDNPRMTAFNDTGWTQPVEQTEEESYWLPEATLSAEWVTMNVPGVAYLNYSFYRQAFCLPLNATGLSANLQLAGDDTSDIYLNGVYLGQEVGAGGADSFNGAGGIQSGINFLQVQLIGNDHGGHPEYGGKCHSGLLFNLAAAYTGLRPFSSAPSMVLAGQEVTFTVDELAIGGRRPYVYKFDFGDGTVVDYQALATYNHTFSTPGVYTATITARAQYGCTGTDTIIVTVLPSSSTTLLANAASVTYDDANSKHFSGATGAGVDLNQVADLSVVKTAISGGTVPGQGVTYQLLVTNNSPQAVTGATVADTLPVIVTGATWTCTASSGSSCTASGTGSISDTVTLLAGGTATYSISGTISPTATGSLENTATVSTPAGVTDLVPANNTSTVSGSLTPNAGLSITKTSSPTTGQPGQTLTYTITVTNAGPSAAVGATVADTFPDDVGNVAWTCTAVGGASCTASGTGNLNDTVDLPVGGTVTYTATGILDPSAVGPISNTATATGTATVSATDTNTPVVTVLTGRVTVNGTPTDGVTVTVVDGAGHSYTTTTSGGGYYTFTGSVEYPLAVGTATVTASHTGQVPVSATKTLVAGTNTQDLALGATTRISGVVFYDPEKQGDAALTVDSYRFENVKVELLNDQGTVVATTYTAVDGSYNFNSPGVGSFTVRVTDPPGYIATRTNPAQVTVVDGTPNEVNFGQMGEPTYVLLSQFRAYEDGGRVVVEWRTAAEQNTVGFYLERRNGLTGQWAQVNAHILPGLLAAHQGGVYRYVDAGASPAETHTYQLVEIETTGRERVYGPYTVKAVGGAPGVGPVGLSDEALALLNKDLASYGYGRQAYTISAKKKARLEAAKPGAGEAKGTAPFEVRGHTTPRRIGPTAAKVVVTKPGIYYLDAGEIASALSFTRAATVALIRSGQLSLANLGEQVAYAPAEDFGGIFFYGNAPDSIYTDENIYWLEQGKGEKGVEMEAVAGLAPEPAAVGQAFFETAHFEKDLYALTGLSDPNSDYWAWEFVLGGYPGVADTKAFPGLDAPGMVQAGDAELSVHFTGGNAIFAHHGQVMLNGTLIGEAQWTGMVPASFTFTFPTSLIKETGNEISVKALPDETWKRGYFYIDSFDLVYPRSYRALSDRLFFYGDGNAVVTISGFSGSAITIYNLSEPRRLKIVQATTIDQAADGTYRVSFVPEGPDVPYAAVATAGFSRPAALRAAAQPLLKDKKNQADYLVIAPEALKASAQELADYRRQQGLITMVAGLGQIQDEFSYGINTPEAIRSFLAYAAKSWNKAPRYVVLVGEGTYDYKNNLGFGDNLLPTLMVSTPYGLAASDNRFADLEGDDAVPEMAIGRLPVVTAAELLTLVAKIKAYEAASGSDAWTKKVLMVADNPDKGGDFIADSNMLYDVLPPQYQNTNNKIYMTAPGDITAARSKLLAALQSGALLMNYFGHGGRDVLADEGLLLSTDVPSLANFPRMPVVSAMTCAAGVFGIPGFDSLSEHLVMHNAGGAVATWSPTGLSEERFAAILDEAFLRALFSGSSRVLGDAVKSALGKSATQEVPPWMRDIYNILGDPALRIK